MEYEILVLMDTQEFCRFWSANDDETKLKLNNVKNNCLKRRDRNAVKQVRLVSSPSLNRILKVVFETGEPTQKGGTLVPAKTAARSTPNRTMHLSSLKHVIYCPKAST